MFEKSNRLLSKPVNHVYSNENGNHGDSEDHSDDEDEDDEEDEDESESEIGEERVPTPKNAGKEEEDLDTDQETDRLLGQQYNDDNGYYDSKVRHPFSKRTFILSSFGSLQWM